MTFADCKNAGSCGKDLCLPEFCHQFEPKQKAVDAFVTTANLFVNRLLYQICEYENRTGEYPKFIMATTRAYLIMQKYSNQFHLTNTGNQLTPRFRNIEIRITSGDGYECFLAGEPISLRE